MPGPATAERVPDAVIADALRDAGRRTVEARGQSVELVRVPG
ncbi:hypothetical protein QOZ88_04635 [Blastococcus sp. BMG 814]|uniref:Uncharacterized protein n=1 Tax=Blastococcus carthaginiensis TaxID=3050034 RepID=A0ABT9I9R8_9ACTN|nr:hypothetical protein [Blastococcus carthaginiensis]MDP5181914.1 hypothetical protein [Blastococcus carthaginiensis]